MPVGLGKPPSLLAHPLGLCRVCAARAHLQVVALPHAPCFHSLVNLFMTAEYTALLHQHSFMVKGIALQLGGRGDTACCGVAGVISIVLAITALTIMYQGGRFIVKTAAHDCAGSAVSEAAAVVRAGVVG